MTVTLEQLQKIFPNSSGKLLANFVDPINKAISDYKINNPAMFIAQVGLESGGFKTLSENLNYSAERLVEVFPKYFHGVNPASYAHNPEKIANRVYASRMGNGNEASGDGWRYRGTGAIQLTGKELHEKFAQTKGLSPEDTTNYMLTPAGAVDSAGWYWSFRGCNATSSDIVATTHKINGGENGLADRKALYAKAHQVLG